MAEYGISGIWKDGDGVITHYAFHTKNENSGKYSDAVKKTKAQAIALLETSGNVAYTWIWNYRNIGWFTGERVQVVGSGTNRYLRSNADSSLTDNLGHLVDFGWITVQ
ncbi:MAG: DUF3892 domain-containing protein [Hymenobacter sp.]|nr:MAG: DUF3892 domain-containing protein [Hymenobacter sp.]